MEEFWSLLSPSTREWLMANAGDAVPFDLATEIDDLVEATGADDVWDRGPIDGTPTPPTDEDDEDDDEDDDDQSEVRYLTDDAVDWIEARANDE
jgi:hypothetical protein